MLKNSKSLRFLTKLALSFRAEVKKFRFFSPWVFLKVLKKHPCVTRYLSWKLCSHPYFFFWSLHVCKNNLHAFWRGAVVPCWMCCNWFIEQRKFWNEPPPTLCPLLNEIFIFLFSTAMVSTTSYPTRRLSLTPPKSRSEWSSTSTVTPPSDAKLSTSTSRCWHRNTWKLDSWKSTQKRRTSWHNGWRSPRYQLFCSSKRRRLLAEWWVDFKLGLIHQ